MHSDSVLEMESVSTFPGACKSTGVLSTEHSEPASQVTPITVCFLINASSKAWLLGLVKLGLTVSLWTQLWFYLDMTFIIETETEKEEL